MRVIKVTENHSELRVCSNLILRYFLIVHDKHLIKLIQFIVIQGNLNLLREINFSHIHIIWSNSNQWFIFSVLELNVKLIFRECGLGSFWDWSESKTWKLRMDRVDIREYSNKYRIGFLLLLSKLVILRVMWQIDTVQH